MRFSRNPKPCALLLFCCLLGLAFPGVVGAQQQPAKEDPLAQARQSYYNLRSQGLLELQCSMEPNWEVMLAEQRKANPASFDEGMKVMKQVHFDLTLGADGALKVTHNTLAAADDHQAKALAQVYGGMEQMITGVFQTASPFLLTSPFPEVNSKYDLSAMPSQYRLVYEEGSSNVVTSMSTDFAITEMKVTSPQFVATVQPQFTRTPQGFLLSGYEGAYVGASPSEPVSRLQVHISYQEIEGLQVFQKVSLSGTYGATPFQTEVAFTGCKVKKR